MSESTALDLNESEFRLAWSDTRAALSSVTGILAVLIIPAIGGLLAAATRVEDSSSTGSRVGIVITGTIVGFWVIISFVYAWKLVKAPRVQRDRARDRLKAIKTQAMSYSIVPTGAGSWKRGNDISLWAEIRNEGRGAQFAATIEGIEGSQDEYENPYAHVPWAGRPKVIADEIPHGESRRLLIGQAIRTRPATLDKASGDINYGLTTSVCFNFTDAPGTADKRTYEIQADAPFTVFVRVSARGVPEIGYSRTIGVTLVWSSQTDDVSVEPATPVPGSESRSTPFRDLLNF